MLKHRGVKPIAKNYDDSKINAAIHIISTFIGEDNTKQIEFKTIEKQKERDVASFSIENGKIYLEASSTIAFCYGFYSLSKKMHWGMIDWEDHTIELPSKLEDVEKTTIETPYKKHYFFNPVSHGYSAPYWDFEEWEYRMKWFAMHGYDMILTPAAFEAIYSRTLNVLGLEKSYIRDYFTGPSFYPWGRFGNISHWNKNPYHEEFCEKRIELQHEIQNYAKAIGMEIIPQAFSGFVPRQIKLLPDFKDIEIEETDWGNYKSHGNFFLSPLKPEFLKIGSLFIEEYEKEFGPQKYYIADSFCEMEIPTGDDAKTESKKKEAERKVINKTSNSLSKMIHDVNPDASWVLTGWMIGYQRWIWDLDAWKALVDGLVDKDKFIIIDAAEDYNEAFWKNGTNWEHFEGFGVNWIYSTIPNMGGNQGYTGPLQWYAKAGPDALKSKYSENLIGYGTSPEGLESNPVTYELLADMGWRELDMPFDEWIENYTLNRYKFFNEGIKKYWDLRVNSINSHLDDHPIYAFQIKPGKTFGRPWTRSMPGWKDAIEQFFEVAKQLKKEEMTELFKADLYRMGSLYIGMQIDSIYSMMPKFIAKKDYKGAKEARDQIANLYDQMDSILASHKLDRLDIWIEWARKWGNDEFESNYYENDAKRIVTTWMPGVEDYAARTWHGLLGKYYKPRMIKHLDSLIETDANDWTIIDDEKWHFKTIDNYTKEMDDPISKTIDFVGKAIEIRKSLPSLSDAGIFASFEFPKNEHYTSTILPISQEGLTNSDEITFELINRNGNNKDIKVMEVHLIGDGKVGMKKTFDKNNSISEKQSFTMKVDKMDDNITANNESIIWILLHSDTLDEAKLIMEVKPKIRKGKSE